MTRGALGPPPHRFLRLFCSTGGATSRCCCTKPSSTGSRLSVRSWAPKDQSCGTPPPTPSLKDSPGLSALLSSSQFAACSCTRNWSGPLAGASCSRVTCPPLLVGLSHWRYGLRPSPCNPVSSHSPFLQCFLPSAGTVTASRGDSWLPGQATRWCAGATPCLPTLASEGFWGEWRRGAWQPVGVRKGKVEADLGGGRVSLGCGCAIAAMALLSGSAALQLG